MKPGRQSAILKIISERDIETQHQLLQALAELGVKSTQATLSRDIKDMRLVKELGPKGTYRYVVGKAEDDGFEDRLRTIFKESVVTCDTAQNIVVIKTLPGLGQGACSAIDAMEIRGLVGSLAGDDTVFLAMRDNDAALAFRNEIESIL